MGSDILNGSLNIENMAGEAKGVQAVMRETQPHALYVYCSPHCINLVIQTVCSLCPVVSNALDLVHTFGTLYHQSGKYKTIFKETVHSSEVIPVGAIFFNHSLQRKVSQRCWLPLIVSKKINPI